jgi:radical SAM protein with 4Fe4S-binding SPASM domain
MLDKYPALKDGYTLLIQPDGGHLYLSFDYTIKLGISRYKHDVNLEGAAILKRCNGLNTTNQIINDICEEFDDVPDSVMPKIIDFLETAVKNEYVQINEYPIPSKGQVKGNIKYITPVRVLFELTSSCNLKCVHCYGDYGKSLENELDKNQIIMLLSKLHEMGTEGLNITGGETLLRKDLLEILDFCYGKFSFSLLTNGTLIDDKFSEKFSKYINSPIQISLYGCDPKTHDAITGVQGSFSKTIKGIKSMAARNVYVIVAYLYRGGNPDEVKKIARFCSDLGISMLRVGSFVKLGRGKDLEWEVPEKEFITVSKILKKLREEYDGKMDIQLWSPGGEMSLEEDIVQKENQKHLKCHIGTYFIVIAPNGDLLPCGLIRWPYGNLLRDDFETLFSADYSRFFSDINAPSKLLCGNCRFLYICRKCHAIALTRFQRVENCAWVNQFQDAPQIIKTYLHEAIDGS